MTLERTIADVLGHPRTEHVNFEENNELAPLLSELREIFIKAGDDDYLIQIVEEEDVEPEEEPLNMKHLANLAGFYNSRYLYELVKYESIRIPVGIFHKFIKPITFDHKDYAILVVRVEKIAHHVNGASNGKHGREVAGSFHESYLKRPLELNLEQVFSLAEKLTNLHVSSLPDKKKNDVQDIIEENYQLVSEFTSERLQVNVNDYLEIVLETNAQFFKNTDKTFEKFNALFKTFKCLQEIYPESNLPIVLCHGNLSSDKVVFDDRSELQFIDHWENIHFGSAAEDLAYLMITSLSPEVRRNNFMKIFRRYYYTLVDRFPVKFKLQDLKEFYLRFLKYSVFFSFPTLVATLQSTDYSDDEKFHAVIRWEAALDDAYDVETDSYFSDNEDNLTAQNSENRSVAEAVMKTRHSTDSHLP